MIRKCIFIAWGLGLSMMMLACRTIKSKAPVESSRYAGVLKTRVLQDWVRGPVILEYSAIINDETGQPDGKTVLNFSDRGQAAAITEFSKKSSNAKDLVSLLNTRLFAPGDPVETDVSSKDVKIRLSLRQRDVFEDTSSHPYSADRVDSVRVTVKLRDSADLFFARWDKYSTEYATYNIASRTISDVNELNISPSLTLGTIAASAGSLSNTKTLQVQDTTQQRVVSLNGYLGETYFDIVRSGTAKTNLLGNTEINLTLDSRYKDEGYYFTFDNLQSGTKFSKPSAVAVNQRFYRFIQLPNHQGGDVKADITVNYNLRHVIKGEKTYIEDDDVIQNIRGTIHHELTLLKAIEVKPRLYYLMLNQSHVKLLNTVSRQRFDLAFGSYNDANAFMYWLIHILPSGGNRITIGEYDLITDNIATTTPAYLTRNTPVTRVEGNSEVLNFRVQEQ